MLSPQAEKSGRDTARSFVVAAVVFLAALVVLVALATRVVSVMQTSATEIDDRRAMRGVQSMVRGMLDRMKVSLQDNAVWNEAYRAIETGTPERFIAETWGFPSADYPLYDGVIVYDCRGDVAAAYLKGVPFDPDSRFDLSLQPMVRRASANGLFPITGFLRLDGGLAIVGLQAIRPEGLDEPVKDAHVLAFVTKVTDEQIASLGKHEGFRNLRLTDGWQEPDLHVPLTDSAGRILKYLSWESDDPGAVITREVRPYLIASGVALIIFIGGVVLAAGYEQRRLRRTVAHSWHLATHDALSGLLNRSGFFRTLDDVRARLAPDRDVVVFLLDLDGFKAVNDTWGHAVGDELIRRVAHAVSTSHPEIRHAARLGGDEFALIAENTADIGSIAAATLQSISTSFMIDGRAVDVGVSIGYAFGEPNLMASEIVRQADLALYRAKETGKGKAIVYESMLDAERRQEAQLEAELRHAISAGKLDTVFQPQFSSDRREIIGVEALARWVRPGGTVSPEIFVALAEKCGLIETLGSHLLSDAMKQAARWPELKLSVNVSPLQLCNPGFAGQVKDLLREHGFDPRRLTLEVTESVLLSNPDLARRSIETLRQIGVTFALDDFGCGYASIGVLREFGFDRIKIDRSIVWSAENDPTGVEVLRATVALARALDVPVSAEGVENANQAMMLQDAGCDSLQGYLLGRPMTAARIHTALKTHNTEILYDFTA